MMTNATDVIRAMTYTRSTMAESFDVDGFTVEIKNDDGPECPYNWDGNSPAIWLSLGNGLTEYGAARLGDVLWDQFTPAKVSRHWRKIVKILDADQTYHDREAREFAADHGCDLGTARQEVLAETLADMKSDSWGYGIDYLTALRDLYRLAGVPAETFQRNGYSQGDSVYGLIVMTPEWAETVGCPYAKPGKIDWAACDKDMSGQADTYGAWCWGNVYGYSITDSNGDDVESCWGFYGSDPMESGIAEAIAIELTAAKRAARVSRSAKVKDLIRAHVPLNIRADVLQAYT